MTQSVIQRSCAAGELSPALGARADLVRYLSGLATCRNFIVQRQGGVAKRPGTRFVAAVKDSTVSPRLLTFVFEAADQTYVLELGAGYIRFFWHGAPVIVTGVAAWSNATAYVVGDLVVSAGINYYAIQAGTNHTPATSPTFWYPLTGDIYEIPTPYTAGELPALNSAQSADVLTIVHPSHPPLELQRLAHQTWTLVPLVTAPSLAAPTGLTSTTGVAGTLTMRYVVTAAKAETFEESYKSNVATSALAAPPTVAAPNVLGWTAVPGAAEYYVYLDAYSNGVYGLIGVATTTSFNDVGYAPDYSSTPPIPRSLFASTDNYPAVVAYNQQRQWFARTNSDPETVWGSRVGAYHNFAISVPLQDDDSVTFIIAGNQLNPVAHIVGLKKFVVLTDAGEWVINGDEQGVVTPTTINAAQQGFVGAKADARPVVVGNALLYVQNRGVVLRVLAFDQEQGGFAGKDLTLYSSHLVDGYALTDLAYGLQPHATIWAVRNDGTLLGLTYLPDEEVAGWHRHDTGELGNLEDKFEAVAVVPDTAAGEDVPYFVVARQIRGLGTRRYIERFAAAYVPDITDPEDAFFVDSGLTYSGAPATVFSGLGHLEGECVAIVADGAVVSDGDRTNLATLAAYTVTAGSVTIPTAASDVHVGLPIPLPELETLDLDVDGTALRDKRKRVQSVTLLVRESSEAFTAGPDATHLIRYRKEPWQASASTRSGPLELNLTCKWEAQGRVKLRHTQPLPFTVLGIIPNLQVGG